MPAVSRALLVAVALCVFQASHANLLPSFDDLVNDVKKLQESTEEKLKSVLGSIDSSAKAAESRIITDVSSSVSTTRAHIDTLISEAKANGMAVADCAFVATTNLTRINVNLPISLAHCSVDYLDAFNYYIKNMENDFSQMLEKIGNATQDMKKCSLIDIPCYWDIFYNVTKFEWSMEKSIAFQVLNAQTAGINLVATITKCYEEKSTQAALDEALVVPHTAKCIEKKKAEANSTAS